MKGQSTTIPAGELIKSGVSNIHRSFKNKEDPRFEIKTSNPERLLSLNQRWAN